MIITKKESKQLRYFARANYKADVKGTVAEDGSKVKHREYPVFGLCYDEKKADNGMLELTNIMVLYKPFTGTTFEELMEALNNILGFDDEVCEKQEEKVEPSQQEQDTCDCLLAGPDCVQTPIPPGPPIAQPIAEPQEEPEHLFGPMSHRGVVGDALNFFKNVKLVEREPQAAEKPLGVLDPIPSGLIKNEAECLEALAPSYENYPPKEPVSVADIPEEVKESVLETAETVTTLVHPEMQAVSKEIKDLSEDGTLTVDVQAVANNSVDSVDMHIDVNKQTSEHESVSDPLGEITGIVNPTFTPEAPVEEPAETADAAVLLNTPIKVYTDTHATADSDVLICPKPVEEPKKKIIVVTSPVCPERHDSRRDFSIEILEEAKQVAEETDKPVITAEQKPKKLTRGELNDLRIKCAVMKLAKSYGEPADMSIGEILLRYPNASMKLNDLYVADRIKPYTISEDAIREAYPDEYETVRKEAANA